jgi:hypothetical protein
VFRACPEVAEPRAGEAEPPATDGAADGDADVADAVGVDADSPRDGWPGYVPSGVLTVGGVTGVLGNDGVLTDGVVRLGVLTWGVVTGPTVTGGTVTLGTLTVGTLTVGTLTVGTLTVGTLTVETVIVGTLIDGTGTDAADAADAVTAGRASAAHDAITLTRRRLIARLPTCPSTLLTDLTTGPSARPETAHAR